MAEPESERSGERAGTPEEAKAPQGPSRLAPYLDAPVKELAKTLDRECEGRLVVRGVRCSCGDAARVFSIEVNEEDGVAVLTCRKCHKAISLYDRSQAWGVRRGNGAAPKTFPYKCSCGGHAFQVAVSMEYPSDPMGEDDMLQFSVAAACLACDEVSVAFDDEAD